MKVEFYVPVKPREPALELRSQLIEAFGGLTSVNGHGVWRDGRGRIVDEPVDVLTVWVDDPAILADHKELKRTLWLMAEDYKRAGKQEAVLFVMDGKHYFV